MPSTLATDALPSTFYGMSTAGIYSIANKRRFHRKALGVAPLGVDRRFDAARSLLALVLGDCGARAAWVRRGLWGFAFYFGGRSGNQQSRESYAVCGGEFGDYVSPFGVGQVGQKVGNHRQPGSVGVSQRWDVRIGFGGLCTGFCTASFRNCPIF